MLQFLRAVERLQHVRRTGYANLGIPDPESVAEHSFSVCWYALLLAEAEGADALKTLRLALLHDLPEALTGDLAAPSVNAFIGAETKHRIERDALARIHADLTADQQAGQQTLLAELDAAETIEARVVHDADKLQMLHRLSLYERRYGLDSEEFWLDLETRDWLPTARTLYESIRDARSAS
jgi:putative hydrolase of HD superfamily